MSAAGFLFSIPDSGSLAKPPFRVRRRKMSQKLFSRAEGMCYTKKKIAARTGEHGCARADFLRKGAASS